MGACLSSAERALTDHVAHAVEVFDRVPKRALDESPRAPAQRVEHQLANGFVPAERNPRGSGLQVVADDMRPC